MCSFLNSEEPVNITLAGYFSKVFTALLAKESEVIKITSYNIYVIINYFITNLDY